MATRPCTTSEDWVEVGDELPGEGGPGTVRIEEYFIGWPISIGGSLVPTLALTGVVALVGRR